MTDIREQDVAWLYIPVDDLSAMSVRKPVCDLLADRDYTVNVSCVDVQAGIEVAMQRNRHDEETSVIASILRDLGIDDRDDVVVVQTPQNSTSCRKRPMRSLRRRRFSAHSPGSSPVASVTRYTSP